MKLDRSKSIEEKIGEATSVINGELARIEKIRKKLGDKANDKRAIRNDLSPIEALDIAKEQLEQCLQDLEPGGRGLKFAHPTNAQSFIDLVEKYLKT